MSNEVSIGQHFLRLLDFNGSENRTSFWRWAAVAFIIVTVIGGAIFVPITTSAISAMQDFAAQNPDQAEVVSGPGHYSISVSGEHPPFIESGSIALFLGVIFGLGILLFAAAVVRRLHDRRRSGFWGLMPLPFILYSSIQMPRMFAMSGAQSRDMALFFSISLSNMLYLVTLIWLVVILAGPSEEAR